MKDDSIGTLGKYIKLIGIKNKNNKSTINFKELFLLYYTQSIIQCPR